jgi:arginase family enzyme
MQVAFPGWLKIERTASGCSLHDAALRRSQPVDLALASLLEQLREPIELARLSDPEETNLSEDILQHLLRGGCLVPAGNGPSLPHLLRSFLPAFLSCPSGSLSFRVSVLGVPCESLSVSGPGQAEGPASIRIASEFAEFTVNAEGKALGFFDYDANRQILEGVSICDIGNLVMEKGEPAERLGERLSQVVFACRQAGSFPLILGGDHSLTHAAVRGLGVPHIHILHIDAHSDIMDADPALLPSSGSVVRSLLGEEWVAGVVSVGLRGVMQVRQQPVNLKHSIVPQSVYRTMRPEAIADMLGDPCYISLDIDVLDPGAAPAVNLPVPAGMSMDEVWALLRAVGAKRKVIGADIVELVPRHDQNFRTARLAAELAIRLLSSVFDTGEAHG